MSAEKRKYAEILVRLLDKRICEVRCPPEMHSRIVKAIFKLKDEDKELRKKWRLQSKSNGEILRLTLRAKVNLYDL